MPNPALRRLIARLSSVAEDDAGISPKERDFAFAVQKGGAEAIPLLLPYQHPRENVRNLAAFILRDIKGLNVSHLDALIQAERQESTWLPPAIARKRGCYHTAWSTYSRSYCRDGAIYSGPK